MSKSMYPKAVEKVHTNSDMAAHRQSVRSFWTIGDGGGGGKRALTGATACGGAAYLGISQDLLSRQKVVERSVAVTDQL